MNNDGISVLVVDDDKDVAEGIALDLAKAGYAAACARDGKAALDILEKTPFDVALVDLAMPVMSGIDLLRAIKDKSIPTVPIIVSGHGEVTSVVAAMRLGAFDFLEKPCEWTQIWHAVERAIHLGSEKRRADTMGAVAARWEATFDASPDAMFVSDTEGKIVLANRAAAERSGVAKEDMVGRSCRELFCGGQHERNTCPFKEGSRLSPDEETEWHIWGGVYRVSCVPLADGAGNDRGVMHVARDITKRTRAEEALRESEETLRAMTAAAQDAIVMMDSAGTISFWNDAAQRVFGWSRQEAIGRNLLTTLVPAADHGQHSPGIRGFLGTGEGPIVGKTVEMTGIRKSGEVFPIELSLSRVRIDEKWNAIGIVRDIGERKNAEKALLDAHRETERLLSSTSVVLIDTDGEGMVRRWNSAAETRFGVAAANAVGKPFADCGIRWDGQTVLAQIEKCRTSWDPVRLPEVRYTRPNGEEGILAVTVDAVRDDLGWRSGFVVLADDVTEQRFMESELAQARKLEAIGHLAAGIAHEINTPTQYVGDNTRFLKDAFDDLLKILDSYVVLIETMKHGPPDPRFLEETEALVAEIDLAYLRQEIPVAIGQSLEGIERVTKIVRSMKEFSHPGTAEKASVDINHAIENTLTVARNEWKYYAEAETDLDPNLPTVFCLPSDLNQVFLNLIVNAAQAIADTIPKGSPEKGRITVSTRHDGDWVEIRIADTGMGIPEPIREKVFSPFFTTKEVGKGTGQGLPIARAIVVDKHGGTIRFETETGKGTTFIVRLPIGAEGT